MPCTKSAWNRVLNKRVFGSSAYDNIESNTSSNLSKKSGIEVQLEEAIARQGDELALSGVLLELSRGIGIVSGLKNASLNSTVQIFDEKRQAVIYTFALWYQA